MLTFTCSSCNAELTIDDHLAGHRVDCTFCKMVIRAPGELKDVSNAILLDIPRCPKCSARRDETKESCGFCGHTFSDRPLWTRFPRTRKNTVLYNPAAARRRIVLGGLLAVVIVVAALLRFFKVDEVPDPSRLPPVERCLRHMILLHFAMEEYAAAKSGPPHGVGSEFWSTILQRDGRTGMLQCPAGCGRKRPSHFRGPAKPIHELQITGVLATTYPDDHEGGINVLLKNGTVLFVPATNEYYRKALAESRE